MSPEYPSAAGAFTAAVRNTHICVLHRQSPGLGHALVLKGFQVVSEQLWPGRHAQTCPGIFGIAEGSTDTQTLLRSTNPPSYIPTIPRELSLNEALKSPQKYLLGI